MNIVARRYLLGLLAGAVMGLQFIQAQKCSGDAAGAFGFFLMA
jgi:hypothetical protein